MSFEWKAGSDYHAHLLDLETKSFICGCPTAFVLDAKGQPTIGGEGHAMPKCMISMNKLHEHNAKSPETKKKKLELAVLDKDEPSGAPHQQPE